MGLPIQGLGSSSSLVSTEQLSSGGHPSCCRMGKGKTHPPGQQRKKAGWAGVAVRAGEGTVEKGCLWPCFMLAACMESYHLSSVFKSLLYTLPLGNQSHFVIHRV